MPARNRPASASPGRSSKKPATYDESDSLSVLEPDEFDAQDSASEASFFPISGPPFPGRIMEWEMMDVPMDPKTGQHDVDARNEVIARIKREMTWKLVDDPKYLATMKDIHGKRLPLTKARAMAARKVSLMIAREDERRRIEKETPKRPKGK